MEVESIGSFIKDLPIWGWVIVFIIYAVIFGDRKVWDYEVKFPLQAGVGRGEVELECFKKKGTKIEISLELEPAFHDKPIDILRNGRSIYTIDAKENSGNRVVVEKKTALEKPEEGDEITIRIGGENIFKGRLVLD